MDVINVTAMGLITDQGQRITLNIWLETFPCKRGLQLPHAFHSGLVILSNLQAHLAAGLKEHSLISFNGNNDDIIIPIC